MVATPSLETELREKGFGNLGRWTRGVDTDLFKPARAIELPFPRPIFVCVGRVAVEKNLEAFLSLDLPGTKAVIGAGPQEAELKQRFPDAKFLGQIENGKLAAHLASADVFVFPSLTDTFGVVQLEALASGVPIAAFPVTGPKDVVGGHPVGAWTTTFALPASRRSAYPARPAVISRFNIRGKTAPGNSSDICAR